MTCTGGTQGHRVHGSTDAYKSIFPVQFSRIGVRRPSKSVPYDAQLSGGGGSARPPRRSVDAPPCNRCAHRPIGSASGCQAPIGLGTARRLVRSSAEATYRLYKRRILGPGLCVGGLPRTRLRQNPYKVDVWSNLI